MTNETLETIKNRRSCRAYKPEQITDEELNAVLEAVRQIALMKNGSEENDLHLRTLEVAQIREDEYFGSLIADDLKGILRDIRSEHRPDTMTADEVSFAENIQN